VEERGARSQRFREVFLAERAVVVREGEARLLRDVDEANDGCLRRRQTRPQRHRRQQEHRHTRAGHSGRTSPFFTAKSTSSAVLCTPSALIRFARCTATVLTLRSSMTAISLFDLPCAMSGSTCVSRCVMRSYGSVDFSKDPVWMARISTLDSSGARYCSPPATARTARVRSFSIAFFRM